MKLISNSKTKQKYQLPSSIYLTTHDEAANRSTPDRHSTIPPDDANHHQMTNDDELNQPTELIIFL